MEKDSHLILSEFIEGPEDLHLKGHSISMIPAINPGELIKIKKGIEPRPGDVVVFRAGDAFVAHRLIWRRGFAARTKGDNNAYCDAPISVFDIVGVVEGKRSRWAFWYYLVRNRIRHHTPCPLRRMFSAAKRKFLPSKNDTVHL